MDLSFWQWLLAGLGLVVAAIAIKIALTFDLNRYLEGRREREKERLQVLCPHTEVWISNGKIFVESRFHKPAMTFNCVCGQCGMVVANEEIAERISRDWANNPDGWMEADKRFRKAYSKFYEI